MTTGISIPCAPPDASGGATVGPSLGHNGGPALEADADRAWRLVCWRHARAKAWKTPPREIVIRRLKRARELGMSYHDYTLEILERGRYL